MVDLASESVTAPAARPDSTAAETSRYESDFSLRKIRVALTILLGQTFATSILPFIALPLLLVPMTNQFGWTPAEFSLATTSLMIVGALSVFPLGYIVDRIGCRPIIILGSLMVGAVTMAISQVNSLFTFCLGFAALGFFGSTGMVYSKVIASLFTKHRGKALAIFGAESAVAGAITPQIIRHLLEKYQWQQTFLILGVTIIVIVPLLYFFLEEPGTAGGSRNLFKFLRTKEKSSDAPEHDQSPAQLEGMTFKQIAMDRIFWLILLATLIAGAPRGALFTYLSPILSDRGFNGQAATANFLSLITLTAAVGSLVGGFALDKFHSTKLAVPFKVLSMLALILLGVVSMRFGGLGLLTLTALLWGFSDGAMRPMGTYFNTRLFGLKAFGGMMGLNSFFFAIFLGLIAPIGGLVQQATGSYGPAIWTLVGFLALGALIYLTLGPYRYGVMVGATKKQA